MPWSGKLLYMNGNQRNRAMPWSGKLLYMNENRRNRAILMGKQLALREGKREE